MFGGGIGLVGVLEKKMVSWTTRFGRSFLKDLRGLKNGSAKKDHQKPWAGERWLKKKRRD